MRTIELRGKAVILVDQSRLPSRLVFVRCRDVDAVVRAIKQMKIRGAPALAAAAAMGLAVTALRSKAGNRKDLMNELEAAADKIKRTRPTAVNLFVGLGRVLEAARGAKGGVSEIRRAIVDEAQKIADEDVDINRRMGKNGSRLIKDGDTILTHCNTGALATVDYGTALGVIRAAREEGKRVKVIATETRPLLQGARLTTWELKREGIPVTLITDGMAGYVMSRGMVDLVLVGADRIAANGDVANKIGTYTLAVLAKRHRVPFYIVAPTATIDPEISGGKEIEIEHRDPSEVTYIGGKRVAPKGVGVLNPAFDVTPANLVTAIITERGIVKPRKIRFLIR